LAAVFIVYPVIKGIYNSLFDFRFGGKSFVGLDNYKVVFTDNLYLLAIKNSLLFVLILVPLYVVTGILIGGSVFVKGHRYSSFVRVSLYVPVVASMVVMTIIWRFMLDSQSGLARYFFELIGTTPVNLLGDARWTFWIIIFILFTINIGQCVVLYVADMISIPEELIEALEIDGGTRLQMFRYILIPCSMPTTQFVMITQTAAILRVFVVIQLLTNGGPYYSSTTMMYLLYQEGFTHGNFGSASALGVVMFIFTLVLVVFELRYVRSKRR